MKLGLVSDIHGNSIALRAVISDATEVGVTHWWVLGDLVALGADPVGVIECLEGLDDVQAIAGNTERYVLRGDRPYPTVDEAAGDVGLIARLAEVASSFAWTRGAVTQAGWFEWLDALPGQSRMTLPDGTRVLGVHASPGADVLLQIGERTAWQRARLTRRRPTSHRSLQPLRWRRPV